MRKNILVILFLCFSLLVFLGCAGIYKKGSSTLDLMLKPQSVFKFGDIPIPVGFRLIPEESYSFQSGNFRSGLLKYRGKADPERVVNFFKEQMLMYNWNPINVIEYGQRILNFERDQESCIVNILPRGNNITIIISVGPRSAPAKKRTTSEATK